MSRAALIAAIATLAVPGSALGGGFATVGLDSLPNGTAPGEAWVAELTVLAHGRADAPVEGLKPAVNVVKADGSGRRRFPAQPTDEPGVYRAAVTFDSPGIWRYSIEDGYAGWTHRYPPVRIGGTAAETSAAPAPAAPVSSGGGSNGGPDLLLALLVALGAGLTAGLLTRLLQRPPRPAQA
jgi:YtkA-like